MKDLSIMKQTKRWFSLAGILCMLICTIPMQLLRADEKPTIQASAQPNPAVVGERIRVTFELNTQNAKNIQVPNMDIDGLTVLFGPSESRSSNVSFINGKMNRESRLTITYMLRADKAGNFQLGVASAVHKSSKLRSNALTIKVLPQDEAGGINPQGNSNTSATNKKNTSDSKRANARNKSNDLFIRAIVSQTKVQEQEAFLLSYKIYSATDLRSFENVKLPDFKGFHSQEVEKARSIQWTREHYNGRNYNTAIYRQFVLFPQQSGDLEIAPARFDAIVLVQDPDADPFDSFFNGGSMGRQIRKVLLTPKLTIHVAALPTRPAGFSGAVGYHFTLEDSVSPEEVHANEAVTLKLKISGVGNLKLINNPKIDWPADFEAYDPKATDSFVLTAQGQKGSRSIEYLAIPRYAGDFTIPAVDLVYYDTKQKKYVTLHTAPHTLKVLPSKGGDAAPVVVGDYTKDKEEVRVLGKDIRYIHRGTVSLKNTSDIWYGSMSYVLCYLIPFIGAIIAVILGRRQAVAQSDVKRQRNKKANKVAVKRLKVAGKLLHSKDNEAFYDEVLKALWGYTSDKLAMPISELSKDNIAEKLTVATVPGTLVSAFIKLLDNCEFARFAPSSDKDSEMDKIYQEAIRVIADMEGVLK